MECDQGNVWISSGTFNPSPVVWNRQKQTTITGYVFPIIDIKLFDIAGPLMTFNPTFRLTTELNPTGWAWIVDLVIKAQQNIDVHVIDSEIPISEQDIPGFETSFGGTSGPPSGPGCEAFESQVIVIGLTLICLPKGDFVMGADDGTLSAVPAHPVELTRDFWIGQFEVRQNEFAFVTGQEPSFFTDPEGPVESVSWLDAVAFANAVSELEGIEHCYDEAGNSTHAIIYDCQGYRLPTGAEWEYAARGGSTTAYSFGDDAAQLPTYGW